MLARNSASGEGADIEAQDDFFAKFKSGTGCAGARNTNEVKTIKCVLLGLLAGCASGPENERLARDPVHAELERRSLSAKELGVEVVNGPGGKSVRWRERLAPRNPVTVPMLPAASQLSSQPHTKALLNGREITLSLDTGAAFTAFGVEDALAANLKIADPKEFKNTFVGLAGAEENYYGLADTLEIGELIFRNVFCVVRPDHGAKESSRLSNILGLASLAKLNWFTLDYHGRTVTFCADQPLPTMEDAVATIPFDFVAMQMRTDIVVNGIYQVATIIDTGHDATIMIPGRLVREIGLMERARKGKPGKYAGVGGVVETRSFQVEEITLGKHQFRNVEVVSGPDDFPPTIGSDFLNEYRVTVDVTKNRVYLAK